MPEIEVINCTEEDLVALYNGSALTFTGCIPNEENLDFLTSWMKENGAELTTNRCYAITGKQMNDIYHLTGDNAYTNDLSFTCFKLDDIKNVELLFIARFQLGGRWFDDIVDNNERREANTRSDSFDEER